MKSLGVRILKKKKKKKPFLVKINHFKQKWKMLKNHRKLRDLDFSHKMGGVGKIWSSFEKGGYSIT